MVVRFVSVSNTLFLGAGNINVGDDMEWLRQGAVNLQDSWRVYEGPNSKILAICCHTEELDLYIKPQPFRKFFFK